jgi:hypothetical protein
MLAILLLAARLLAWGRIGEVNVGPGRSYFRAAAGPEGIYLGWRRRLPSDLAHFGPYDDAGDDWGIAKPSPWWWSGRIWPGDDLQLMCIRTTHEWWIAPGLWLGYGRDLMVDYFDVILPFWMLIPLSLALPARSVWRWHRRRRGRGFELRETARGGGGGMGGGEMTMGGSPNPPRAHVDTTFR